MATLEGEYYIAMQDLGRGGFNVLFFESASSHFSPISDNLQDIERIIAHATLAGHHGYKPYKMQVLLKEIK